MMDEKVRYMRESGANYLIISAPRGAEDSYECRMLAENRIPGLLSFEVRRNEDAAEYFYEISGRQPISRIFRKRKLSGDDLRKFLPQVISAIRRAEAYLLDAGEILLDPDYIYLNPDDYSAGFCLVPGRKGEKEELSDLLRYLLDRTDNEDADGLLIAYNAFRKSREENYRAEDLLDIPALGRERRSADRWTGESAPSAEEVSGELRHEKEEGVPDGEAGAYGGAAPGAEYGPEENGRPEGGKRIVIEGTAAAAALLAAAWYLMGRTALILSAAVILFAVVYAVAGIRRKSRTPVSSGTVRVPVSAGEMPRSPGRETEYSPREESFSVLPVKESEMRAAREREEKDRLRRQQEESTELIAGDDPGEALAFLIPEKPGEERIVISYFPFVIGKHPELADYVIARPTVSRMHLSLDRREGVTILTDLNSRNGTKVNGYRLEANETVSLSDGDIIVIADAEYRYRSREIMV